MEGISPADPVDEVITQLKQTECLFAEAMHGAIIADSLRIPWLPIKAYGTINEFKWNDWTSSMQLDFNFNSINAMYSKELIEILVKNKTKLNNKLIQKTLVGTYQAYQNSFMRKSTMRKLEQLKKMKPILSDESIFQSKLNQILDKIELVKKRYSP